MINYTAHDALMLAFSAPAPGVSAERFNAWTDDVHVPEVIRASPGILRATRYRLSSEGPEHSSPLPFLTVYGISGDPLTVLGDLRTAELSEGPVLNVQDRPPFAWVYGRLP